MISLGISEDFYDSGVALCDGADVFFASNEERYTRRKNEGGFPHNSLAAMFEFTRIEPSEIELICVSGHMTPPFPVRLFPPLHDWMFNTQRSREDTFSKRLLDFLTFATPMPHSSENSLVRKAVKPLLKPVTRMRLPESLRKKPMHFVEHHRAHAAGAWSLSGFEEALCITSDGMGDGLSLTVSQCAAGREIERLWSAVSSDSLGVFFEVLAEAFGFTPCRDEGKITGLAASGDPTRIEEPSPFLFADGQLHYQGHYGREGVEWINTLLRSGNSREDIAAWAQSILESNIVAIARCWLKKTGLRHLAVAGGVFANVKLNQRLHELSEVLELFVCPNMGDGGLSLGAIRALQPEARQKVRDVFWGESYSEAEIEASLKRANLHYDSEADMEERIADLLAEGHIVARFRGRMEWGPRALGNRSILVRTSDRQVVDRLNTLLRRSDFMPFAPALLDEDAGQYLVAADAARHAAQFMTVCFDCTDSMKREHPAVVHLDGTARAQLVREESNPALYRILSRYKDRSNSSVILNTSFNIHEEPIVRTPDEAIAAFRSANLDYLAIGNFLVQGPQRPQ